MMRPQYLLTDRQGSLVERLSLGIAALRVVEVRQVVENDGQAGIMLPKLFHLLEGSQEMPFCLSVVTLFVELGSGLVVDFPVCCVAHLRSLPGQQVALPALLISSPPLLS